MVTWEACAKARVLQRKMNESSMEQSEVGSVGRTSTRIAVAKDITRDSVSLYQKDRPYVDIGNMLYIHSE